MLLNNQSIKWPQIDAAFRYIQDNPSFYKDLLNSSSTDVLEFGTGSGRSLCKIVDYLKQLKSSYPYVYGFDSWEGLPAESENVQCFSKFQKGMYKYYKPDELTLRQLLQFPYINLYGGWFDQLDNIPYFDYQVNALLIHIDCDLYISTKQALDWCFRHRMIKQHTLIAFDEFTSTKKRGGEDSAFYEIVEKYDVDTEEVWHQHYYDKDTGQRIRQSLWEVIAIGDKSD